MGTKFGTQTIGPSFDTSGAGAHFGNVYTAPKSAAIASIWVYAQGGTNSGSLAPIVYNATSTTVPTTLVGDGGSTTIASGQAAGWVQLPITNGASVVSGQQYLVGVFTNPSNGASGLQLAYDPATGTNCFSLDSGGAFPTPQSSWTASGTYGTSTADFSFYIELADNVTASVTATSAITATALTTRFASATPTITSSVTAIAVVTGALSATRTTTSSVSAAAVVVAPPSSPAFMLLTSTITASAVVVAPRANVTTTSSITATAVATPPLEVFVPPSVPLQPEPWRKDLLLRFYTEQIGVSVIFYRDGTHIEGQYFQDSAFYDPSVLYAYRGGYVYDVTPAESIALHAAGYTTQFITGATFTPGGGTYGSGIYGSDIYPGSDIGFGAGGYGVGGYGE